MMSLPGDRSVPGLGVGAVSYTHLDVYKRQGLGWRDAQRVEFLLDNLTEALSPSNLPLVNPASAKAAIDTGGANFARGMSAFAKDMPAKPRVPQMVEVGLRRGPELA